MGRRISARPACRGPQSEQGQDMAADTNRENEIFRYVAAAMMVVLITFGVLELMNVIHV